MSDINVLSVTQRIIVDPFSSSVAVINAGPMGPAGPVGEVSVAYLNTELAKKVSNDRLVLGMQDFEVTYGSPTRVILPAMPGWQFDPIADNYIGTYRGDTRGWLTAKVEVLWSAETNAAGDIYFYFEAWRTTHAQGITNIDAEASVIAAPGAANNLRLSQLGDGSLNLSANTSDSVRAFRLSRAASVASDTYPGNVYVHAVILTKLS